MDENYAKAYTEVLELLKYLPEDEYCKIPPEKIQFYEKNKDKNYIFNLDTNFELNKQNISKEANAIIISLFRDYFATDVQNKKLNSILIRNQRKLEESKYDFDYDKVFEKNKRASIDEEENQNLQLAKNDDTFFKKLKRIILSIFSKKY